MVLLQSVVSGLLSGGVYALLGLGFALTLGSLNYVNFAHGAMVVMGMYAALSGVQWLGVSPIVLAPAVTLFLVAVAAMLFPLVVAPTLRKGHEVQIVVTLLLMNFLTALYELIFLTDFHALEGEQKAWLIRLGSNILAIERAKFASFVLVIAITAALHLFLRHAAFGKFIRASISNPMGARVVGIDAMKVSFVVFVIGVGCAGLAGALLLSYSVVEPYLGLDLTVIAFIVSVMAGTSLWHIVYSGLAFGVIESVAGSLVSESFSRVVVYSIFICLLILRPQASVIRNRLARRRPQDAGSPLGVGG